MRVVLDTNVIVSGLLWGGPPRRWLDLARKNTIALYTSAVLLAELAEVLAREKFTGPLVAHGLTPNGILRGYAALAQTVAAPLIARTVPADADDDAVIACALAAKASLRDGRPRLAGSASVWGNRHSEPDYGLATDTDRRGLKAGRDDIGLIRYPPDCLQPCFTAF